MRQIFGDEFSNEFFAGVAYPIGDDATAPLQPRPFTIPTVKRYQPPRSTANKLVTLSVGDGQRRYAPGESFELELRPQVELQLKQLQLLQYPQGDPGGGTRCCWPIEACYVGDRVIPGPMALYDGLADAPPCKVGWIIRLRLRNPLNVSAAICGSFIGRTYVHPPRIPSRAELAQPRPFSAAELECLVTDHAWQATGDGVSRTCSRCGRWEVTPQSAQPQPFTDDQLEDMVRRANNLDAPRAAPAPLTAAQLEEMTRDWKPLAAPKPLTAADLARICGGEEPRCCCGERTVHRCQRCGEPRCSAHLHGSPSMCCMSDGLPEPGCAMRAAKLAKRCAICNAIDPLPSHGSVGWVYGAGAEAFCKTCIDARGGADAFCIYRATHDGAVPPVGSKPCVDCGTATPGYLVDAHAGGHCERCARKHRAATLPKTSLYDVRGAAVVCPHSKLVAGTLTRASCRATCGVSAWTCPTHDVLPDDEVPLANRTAARLPDHATAKRAVERARTFHEGHDNVQLGARRFIYCEAAPPREVVEGTVATLDGDECGGVPRTPFIKAHLCYSARQLVAWERHEAHQRTYGEQAADATVSHDVAACRAAHDRRAAKLDRDTAPPKTRDAYGGVVILAAASTVGNECAGWRCALCGAWLREVLR